MLKYCFMSLMLIAQPSWAAFVPKADEKQLAMSVHDVVFPGEHIAGEDIKFVVNGMFPNTCYSFYGIDVKHVQDFKHEVQVFANVVHAICAMVMIPFTEEGSLGILKPGRHMVVFIASDGTSFEKALQVK